MSLPSFKQSSILFQEPYKTLVKLADEGLHSDYLSNYLVLGKYDGEEKIAMNAWSIVGLAPGCHGFLECRLMSGKETDRPYWSSELQDVIGVFDTPKDYNLQKVTILGGVLHSQLGLKNHHIVGMISLHQTIKSKHSFAVLWQNTRIKRPIVELIMKYVLEERLKAKV